MAAQPKVVVAVPEPVVEIREGVLHIDGFASTDPDSVAFITGSTDAETAVREAIAAGARVLGLARARWDTAVVEREFEHLQARIAQMLASSTAAAADGAAQMLRDPEKGVNAALQGWRTQIESTLAATFDPKRNDSAIGLLSTLLRDAGARQDSSTRRLLDPSIEDGPLGQVVGRVREQITLVLDAVARLAEQVAADRAGSTARAEVMELTAVKGLDYEAQVGDLVTALCAKHGDVTTAVGQVRGDRGSRKGDLVVEVDAPGSSDPVRYVVEVKDRRLSLAATLAELEAAARNRGATAAVAVFSRAEHCPVPTPFTEFSGHNAAVVVLDKDDPNPLALQLACAWARWVARRSATSPAGTFDAAEHTALVEEACGKLRQLSDIRRNHTLATKHISVAGGLVDELDANLRHTLDRLARLADCA